MRPDMYVSLGMFWASCQTLSCHELLHCDWNLSQIDSVLRRKFELCLIFVNKSHCLIHKALRVLLGQVMSRSSTVTISNVPASCTPSSICLACPQCALSSPLRQIVGNLHFP